MSHALRTCEGGKALYRSCTTNYNPRYNPQIKGENNGIF